MLEQILEHYLFIYFQIVAIFSNSGRKSVTPGLVVNNTATSIFWEEGIDFDTKWSENIFTSSFVQREGKYPIHTSFYLT